MSFTCENCNKIFSTKQNLENHLNRKIKCSPETTQRLENKKFECQYCQSKFTQKQNLKRHLLNGFCKGLINYVNITLKKDLELEDNKKKILEIENNLKNIDIEVENNQISEPLNNKTTIKNEIKKVKGFIYILKEREFIKTNENIYKIGKTSKENVIDRIKQYPNDSLLFGYWIIPDIDEFERLLKSSFRLKFKNKKEIGTEYFEGNIDEMKEHIENLYKLHF